MGLAFCNDFLSHNLCGDLHQGVLWVRGICPVHAILLSFQDLQGEPDIASGEGQSEDETLNGFESFGCALESRLFADWDFREEILDSDRRPNWMRGR